MKNILVPIDFSENSATALVYAFHLAEHMEARLELHHVILSSKSNGEANELKKEARERLDAFAKGLIHQHSIVGADYFVSAHISPKFDTIAELDAMKFTDLVVMGTKGASGLKEIFFGSNAIHLIENSSRPVLVIPEYCEYRNIDKILLCSDFDPVEDDEVFFPVKKLALDLDAEVRIAHIKTDDGPPDDQHILESRRELHYFGKEVKHSLKVIRHNSILEGINSYIDNKGDNDLVVLLNREHSTFHTMFNSTLTRKFAFHPRLPLMVLKNKPILNRLA